MECKCFAQDAACAVAFALLVECRGEHICVAGEFGAPLTGPLKFGGRFLDPAQPNQGEPQRMTHIGLVAALCECLSQYPFGFFVRSPHAMQVSQIDERRNETRIAFEGPAIFTFGKIQIVFCPREFG